MSCEHGCPKPPPFPAPIVNRPGLERIRYRIGNYDSFRRHMLARLDQEPLLSGFTHRAPDDPAIALLECTAIVAEVVAFYQTLYANESFLRTAEWRESVSALVALTGYRLAPGVGGLAQFAVAVSGDAAVEVPLGFGFQAQLEGLDAPSVFETTETCTAFPHLGQFQLYRPRLPASNITAGESELELQAVGGAEDIASRTAIEFSPGDRLMLVSDSSMFDDQGPYSGNQVKSEIVIVKEVEQILDRIVLRFEGALGLTRGATIRAFRIDRSFRHFGFDAPRRIGKLNETTGIMNFEATVFDRLIYSSHTFSGDDEDFYTDIAHRDMPLESEVDDLAVGAMMICEGTMIFDGIGSRVPFAVVREIEEVRSDTLTWGGVNGACSVVTLTEPIVPNSQVLYEKADLRRMRFHEVTSPELTLRAATEWEDGPFELSNELVYHGTHGQVSSLVGRALLFQDAEGVLQNVRVETEADELSLTGRDEVNAWPWTLRFDQPPRYDREAFDEVENTITVYGNLVAADEGETQKEAVLGTGDARQKFQTFRLPKAPLTYHLDQSRTPPQVPELELRVAGVLWEAVDELFGKAADAHVYVVRQDDAGDSYVQFGDGITGARLPSGKNNVTALFRIKNGSYGSLEAGATPSAKGKLKELTETFLPSPVVGGAEPETEEVAREAAPLRMQSLGRLVGLSDYEAETLSLPGVLKARAAWVAPSGVPRLRMTVLTEGGTEAEAQQVAESLAAANRCRGPARFNIMTVRGVRQFVHVAVSIGYSAELEADAVEVLVAAALGVTGSAETAAPEEGLFGLRARQFGQGAHASQVIGVIQQVPGVTWVRLDALVAIPLGSPPETDPDALAIPDPSSVQPAVSCPTDAMLALHANHFVPSFVRETAEACS